jgi:hypothetical protein
MAAYNPVFEYLRRNGQDNKARILKRQLLDSRAKVDPDILLLLTRLSWVIAEKENLKKGTSCYYP